MDSNNLYGGTTLNTLYASATPLAASASTSPALDVRNYEGTMVGLLTATSATGDETLFVELMQCSSATNSAATQLTTRRYFSTVSNPTSGYTQQIRVPVQDIPNGFIKARFTSSAASVYTVNLALQGRKQRIDS